MNRFGPKSTRSRSGCRENHAEIVLHDDPEIPRDCNVHFLVDDVLEAVKALVQAGCTLSVPPFDVCIGKCPIVSDPTGNSLNHLDVTKGRFEYNLKKRP